jgi:hypothetical protein
MTTFYETVNFTGGNLNSSLGLLISSTGNAFSIFISDFRVSEVRVEEGAAGSGGACGRMR